jgi:hypothetical protein
MKKNCQSNQMERATTFRRHDTQNNDYQHKSEEEDLCKEMLDYCCH